MKISIMVASILMLGGCISINKCDCNCCHENQDVLGNSSYEYQGNDLSQTDVNLGAFNDKRYVWMYWTESTNNVKRTVK